MITIALRLNEIFGYTEYAPFLAFSRDCVFHSYQFMLFSIKAFRQK